MKDVFRAGNKQTPVSTRTTEVELQSQSDPVALQPDHRDEIEGPKSSDNEVARALPVRAKAMAASSPGTEYWLG